MNKSNIATTNDVVTTDKLIGIKVKNALSEKIGDIDQLVIDKKSGRVCYVTLGVGGFLGIGERFIAVPWNALNYDPNESCFILNMDKTQLEKMPALNSGWSDWSNEKWGSEIHQQFGTKPYWNKNQI